MSVSSLSIPSIDDDEDKKNSLATRQQDRSSLERILEQYYGYKKFRAGQLDAIEACLSGRDSFVMMATGSGKSVCYQLPALITSKPMLVVSPLIALMLDQTMGLQRRGIRACFLNSSQCDKKVWHLAETGFYSIIYISPERLVSWMPNLQRLVDDVGITGFAIDESHCMSSWGHDLRPTYRDLSALRDKFPSVPIMALTATATPHVQDDIIRSLRMRSPLLVRTSFNRSNLHYVIRLKSDEIICDINAHSVGNDSCIVYCLRVQETELLSAHLCRIGISAAPYHARLRPAQRTKVHRAFVNDELQVITATLAYGMGIDKPNIRTVIHYGMSKSIEQYYQESGRAGRDGLPSKCIMFWDSKDMQLFHYFEHRLPTPHAKRIMKKGVVDMTTFVSSTQCRRTIIMKHFGEEWNVRNCDMCDNCLAIRSNKIKLRNYTDEARKFILAVQETGERFGLGIPVAILRGSRRKSVTCCFNDIQLCAMSSFGALSSRCEGWLKAFGQMLLNHNVLEQHFCANFDVVCVSDAGAHFAAHTHTHLPAWIPSTLMMKYETRLNSSKSLSAATTRVKKNARRAQRRFFTDNARANCPDGFATSMRLGMNAKHFEVFEALRMARRNIARRLKVAPHHVIDDSVLVAIARVQPQTHHEMLKIRGVTATQMNAVTSSEFLSALSRFHSICTGDNNAITSSSSSSTLSHTQKASSSSTLSHIQKASSSSTLSHIQKASSSSTISHTQKASSSSTLSHTQKASTSSTLSHTQKASSSSTLSHTQKASSSSTLSHTQKASSSCMLDELVHTHTSAQGIHHTVSAKSNGIRVNSDIIMRAASAVIQRSATHSNTPWITTRRAHSLSPEQRVNCIKHDDDNDDGGDDDDDDDDGGDNDDVDDNDDDGGDDDDDGDNEDDGCCMSAKTASPPPPPPTALVSSRAYAADSATRNSIEISQAQKLFSASERVLSDEHCTLKNCVSAEHGCETSVTVKSERSSASHSVCRERTNQILITQNKLRKQRKQPLIFKNVKNVKNLKASEKNIVLKKFVCETSTRVKQRAPKVTPSMLQVLAAHHDGATVQQIVERLNVRRAKVEAAFITLILNEHSIDLHKLGVNDELQNLSLQIFNGAMNLNWDAEKARCALVQGAGEALSDFCVLVLLAKYNAGARLARAQPK